MVYCGSGTETKIYPYNKYFNDPMVYCGSGTETILFIIFKKFGFDPMVYCGSGTETKIIFVTIILILRSYGLLRKRY